MAYRINSGSTLDPVENTGFIKGTLLSVSHAEDTASAASGGQVFPDIPVFYNCPEAESVQRNGSLKNSSKAFCRGDEVIIRTHKGGPSHIIGFAGDLWPCIQVPAFAFSDVPYVYDETDKSFDAPASPLFSKRYKTVDLDECYQPFTTYVNQTDADTTSGFVSDQTHWTDSTYNRDSKFYCNGEFIYSTYNSETFTHVFNGTRSNILGSYIHPNGWGAVVYQVNTFYDWRPQNSGRVLFDFYLYTSTGTHTKLASAYADVTDASAQAYGECAYGVQFFASDDSQTGKLLTGTLKIYEAGLFTSDGSTNTLGRGDCKKMLLIKIMNGAEKPEITITEIETNISGRLDMPDGSTSDDSYKIYIKNR